MLNLIEVAKFKYEKKNDLDSGSIEILCHRANGLLICLNIVH